MNKLTKALGVFLLLAVGYTVGQSNASRFELKRSEVHENDGARLVISAIHDKESGVEVLCTQNWYGIHTLSCVPTGRNWK